jgi:hypothetical protein
VKLDKVMKGSDECGGDCHRGGPEWVSRTLKFYDSPHASPEREVGRDPAVSGSSSSFLLCSSCSLAMFLEGTVEKETLSDGSG